MHGLQGRLDTDAPERVRAVTIRLVAEGVVLDREAERLCSSDQLSERACRLVAVQACADLWQRLAVSLVFGEHRDGPECDHSAHRLVGFFVLSATGDRRQDPNGLLSATHEPAKPPPGVETRHA